MNRKMAVLILLPLLPAAYARENTSDRPLNEFRHEGGALVCFTDSCGSKGYLPCLRIGALTLGMTVKDMEEEIKKSGGHFEETHLGKGDAEARLYSFPSCEGTGEIPHLVVAFSNGKAETILLSGKGTSAPLAFSSIRLGDDSLQVVRLIGPATTTEHDPETGETLWDYGPFPFRIGLKEGKVFSILLQKGD